MALVLSNTGGILLSHYTKIYTTLFFLKKHQIFPRYIFENFITSYISYDIQCVQRDIVRRKNNYTDVYFAICILIAYTIKNHPIIVEEQEGTISIPIVRFYIVAYRESI